MKLNFHCLPYGVGKSALSSKLNSIQKIFTIDSKSGLLFTFLCYILIGSYKLFIKKDWRIDKLKNTIMDQLRLSNFLNILHSLLLIKQTFNSNSLDEFSLLLNSNLLKFNQVLNSITTKTILIQEHTSKIFEIDLLKIHEVELFNLIRKIFNIFDQSKNDIENIKVQFSNYLKDNEPNHVICFYNFKDTCEIFKFSGKSKRTKDTFIEFIDYKLEHLSKSQQTNFI